MGIYDKQTQEEIEAALKDEGTRSKGVTAIISAHAVRREMMQGMNSRMQLSAASKSEWSDPREADGVPIFARESPGSTKVNHKLHTTFDRTIIGSKASYFVGIPPKITIKDNENVTEMIAGHFKRMGFDFKVNELSQRASGRGTSFILLSSPPEYSDVYFMLPYEWSCAVIYDSITGEPTYAVQYWYEDPEKDEITAILYDTETAQGYIGTVENMTATEEAVPHGMASVPIVEFPNNSERLGDVELTLSLQDAFDIVDSDLVSEVSQLRLAYLLLSGDVGGAVDDEWLEQLKQTGVLTLDTGGDARFLEKSINSDAIERLKADLESRVYRYSNSYNPDELGSDGTMTAYQIRRKLFRLESSTMEAEALFRAGLVRVIQILSDFYSLNIEPGDVDITFTRNTPRNVVQDIADMTNAGYMLSQARMAALSPLDVDQSVNEQELQEAAGPIEFGIDGDAPAAGADPAAAVEAMKLSGIQIRSAGEIIAQVADGTLSRQAGLNQLELFLGMTAEQAARVMGPVKVVKAVKVKEA